MYLKISFLNFNFTMICIIHKILVLIKKRLNYFKDNIFECFFRKYNRLSFFLYYFFIILLVMENPRSQEGKIFKDTRNLFRLTKEIKGIKDILRECRGIVDITAAQFHSTKPEFRFCAGSNPARGMQEIYDGEDL